MTESTESPRDGTPAPRAAGLKDVAAAAGVSWKTVSNVVNGSGRVSPATRERVEAVIAQLGYRPSLAGRQLRQGRTRLLALAIPEIHTAYFAALAHAMIAAARTRGYRVFIEETGGDPEVETALARGTGERLFDGVILSPLGIAISDADALRGAVPMVLLGERGSDAGAPSTDHFSVDNVAAAAEATRHLLAAGRRRPAFLGAQPATPPGTASLRQEGFELALREAGLEPRAEWMLPADAYTRRAGVEAVERILPRVGDIDALVCANDDLALGALHAFRRNGVRVPADVAVTGWDNTEAGRYAAPTLTTVAPDVEGLAEAAIACLVQRVEGAAPAPAHRTVSHRLLVRESSAPR
ncbi:LacI family DNA-binding transcriptional regulator [Microbacterium rhizophilus]|uniref:LacI family DNA-binding transcriptional regulator n=1 Tax=Microbacterium rhizophilus TaxID=3138934 RepID=UPI0031EE36F2